MATGPTGRDIGTDIAAIGIIATAIVAIAMGGGIHWPRSVQGRSLAAQ
jgi:hypothetical protein